MEGTLISYTIGYMDKQCKKCHSPINKGQSYVRIGEDEYCFDCWQEVADSEFDKLREAMLRAHKARPLERSSRTK